MPPPTPEPRPPTPQPPERGGYLAAEESRRQLTAAHLALKRGQVAEADRAVQEYLTRFPEDAAAHEMLGDVRLAGNDFGGAASAYRAAMEREPGRATAETKLARATLRQGEDRRRQSFGAAYASEGRALLKAGAAQDRGRLTRLAVLSAVLPGLGQMLEGAFGKGAILIGVYVLGCLLLTFTGLHWPPSGGTLLALAILTLDWLYAVVDAARTV